jgi:hypothetical protein
VQAKHLASWLDAGIVSNVSRTISKSGRFKKAGAEYEIELGAGEANLARALSVLIESEPKL